MSALGVAVDGMRQPCGAWTGPSGVVHIREAGTGLTFCGDEVGAHTAIRPVIGCSDCVRAAIKDYATHYARRCL